MRLLVVLFAILAGAVLGQEVTVDKVTAEDIVRLFDRSVAIEVDVPEGARRFSLAYGQIERTSGFSTSLVIPPDNVGRRLRVVVFLPDQSVVDPCPADEAEATVIVIPEFEFGSAHHHRQKACVPHPAKTAITGATYTVPEEVAPRLETWTPLLFHAWLQRAGESQEGEIESILVEDMAFVVQVYFSGAESMAAPAQAPLGLREVTDLSSVADLLGRYGGGEQEQRNDRR